MQTLITNRAPIDIDDELKALIEATKDHKRGAVVKHTEIVTASTVEKNARGWSKLIKKWRQWFTDERQITLRAVPGVGYQLLTEMQQLEQAMRFERQGSRRFGKARLTAGMIDKESLDETAQEIQSSIVATAEGLQASFKGVRAERRALLSRQESLPRLEFV